MNAYFQKRALFAPQIFNRPATNLGIVMVIPSYDEPFLILTLMRLLKCERPSCSVEIIVVINDSEKDNVKLKEEHLKMYHQASEWAKKVNKPRFKFHILYHDELPRKHAGVGLARKIGMDEAVFRLEKVKNPQGIIACFDADSRCDVNYFVELEKHFKKNPKAQACTIYFEHPLSGIDHEKGAYEAITLYELHLRYFIHMQALATYPFSNQTIGSSMAVRCKAYQLQGGMNKRQAGEDFYFIHKFSNHPHFKEIKTTRVLPSSRVSHRVPFGTGKAVGSILANKGQLLTYAPHTFLDLKVFLENIYTIYKGEAIENLPPSFELFLKENHFEDRIAEMKSHTSNFDNFKKRFFQWFTPFTLVKFVHHARDHHYPDMPVEDAARWYLKQKGQRKVDEMSPKSLLLAFRKSDKNAL